MSTLDTQTLLGRSRAELIDIIQADDDLIAAIYNIFPEASEHVGYELFDREWIRMYGRQILRAVGHLKDVQSWNWIESTAVGMAIDAIANDLLKYLGLPPTSTLAVIALTVLLVQGLTNKPEQRESA